MIFLGEHVNTLIHGKFFENLFKSCDSLPIKTQNFKFKFENGNVIISSIHDSESKYQFIKSFKDKMNVICKSF